MRNINLLFPSYPSVLSISILHPCSWLFSTFPFLSLRRYTLPVEHLLDSCGRHVNAPLGEHHGVMRAGQEAVTRFPKCFCLSHSEKSSIRTTLSISSLLVRFIKLASIFPITRYDRIDLSYFLSKSSDNNGV